MAAVDPEEIGCPARHLPAVLRVDPSSTLYIMLISSTGRYNDSAMEADVEEYEVVESY